MLGPCPRLFLFLFLILEISARAHVRARTPPPTPPPTLLFETESHNVVQPSLQVGSLSFASSEVPGSQTHVTMLHFNF